MDEPDPRDHAGWASSAVGLAQCENTDNVGGNGPNRCPSASSDGSVSKCAIRCHNYIAYERALVTAYQDIISPNGCHGELVSRNSDTVTYRAQA